MLKATVKKTNVQGLETYQGLVTAYNDEGVKVWSESTNIDVELKENAQLDADELLRFHESLAKYPDSQF